MQFSEPHRLLEYIHDFIIFDGGRKRQPDRINISQSRRRNHVCVIKKTALSGIRKVQGKVLRWFGWHSGFAKMLWMPMVVITDRDELDKQIETGFKDAGEKIRRARSGAQLVSMLNEAEPWLICTLIHKFGNQKRQRRHIGRREESGKIARFLFGGGRKEPSAGVSSQRQYLRLYRRVPSFAGRHAARSDEAYHG